MSRKIEWNPQHINSEDQENEFIKTYLTWTPVKKWRYLLALISKRAEKKVVTKSNRKIEWI